MITNKLTKKYFKNSSWIIISKIAFITGTLFSNAWGTTSINHQFSPSVINQGDTSRYTITVTNDSTSSGLTGVKATIFLDNTVAAPNTSGGHITVASGTVVSNTCGFTGISASAGDNKIVLTGGAIAAGTLSTPAQCVFSMDLVSTSVGTFHAIFPASTSPSATVTGYEAAEGAVTVQNTTTADITLQVNALSAPTGSKSYSPSPAIAGDPTTLTITLSNPNAGSTMPLASFVDNLPSGMEVAATPASSISCTGTGAVNGTFSPTAGSTTLTLTGGTIGQSGSCTLSVKVVVPTISGTSQSLTNSLATGAIQNTRGLTSSAFNRSLTVNSPIGVSKSFNPTTVPAGQPSLMTIVLTNNSTTALLPVSSFIDDFSSSTLSILDVAHGATAAPTASCTGTGAITGTLTDSGGASLTNGNTSLKLSNATIAKSGGTCTIQAYVTSTVDGTHTNTIAADAVTNSLGHHSPSASANLAINGQLTLNKTATVTQVAPGQWTQFTVTINNWSGGDVTGTNFTDVLPTGMVLEGSNPVSNTGCTGGTWTGSDGDTQLSWSGGTITKGSGTNPGVCTIVFKARLPSSASTGTVFTNVIPAYTGLGTDLSGTCSGASCSVGNGNTVSNPAASPAVNVTTIDSVALTKSFSPSSIAQGGLSTMTLVVRNRVVGSVTSVNLTDSFPSGITLAANPAATMSGCGSATLQAYPGSSQLVLSSGTIAARGASSTQTDCTITAKVTSTTIGAGAANTNRINPSDLSTSIGTIPNAVTAILTVTTGLTGSKSFTPSSVTSGGTSRVKITVNNTSNGQLTNVSINDPLGTGLAIANPANAATSCTGSPAIVANPGATTAQLYGATLNAGASCDYSFDVATSGSGSWSNTIPVGGISSAEGVSNVSAVSASLSAVSGSVNINKSFNPVVISGGAPSTLTLTLTNPSASVALQGVSVTDVFPTGIQVYAVPNVVSTCSGGTVTAVGGDGKVSLSGATIAANASCTIAVQVTSVKYLNLTNVIPAGALTTTEGFTNPLAVSATLTTLQGLGVMKAFSPAYVVANAVTRLKMTLVSTYDPNAPTPLGLTGVSYTDTLPSGLVIAATPNASTTCPGTGAGGLATLGATAGASQVNVSNASIAPGTNCSIEVNILAPSTTGTYTNIIPANAITSTQGSTNGNAATANLYVVPLPTVSKAFGTSPVQVGASSALTITISNGAAVDLTAVALTDALPTGLAIASTANASTTCSNATVTANPGAATLSISGATIPHGGSCTFKADVRSLSAGTYANNIPAGALVSNEGLSNPGAANATVTVRSTPVVSKNFAPVSILSSGTSRLTINLSNSNATAITLSSAFVDALPGNVVVAATPNKGGTCTGTVTANAGDTSITYASGASIPAGGCSIAVDVSANADGVYTNVIAAGQLATSAGNSQDPAVASLAVGSGALVPPTVAKSFSPHAINVGDTSVLTLTLGNPNSSALTLNADVVDTFPSNLKIATTPGVGGTCTGTVTANAGGTSVTYASGSPIPAGGCSITVNVTSDTAGSYTNKILAGALQTSGGNNALTAIDSLTVASLTPPTVIKSFTPNTINLGGLSRLVIALGNSNATALTLNSDLTDTFPSGVTVSAVSADSTCTAASISATVGSSTVTYLNGATIPAGGCTIQLDVTASSNSGSPYTNTISAGSLSTNAGSNGAPATDKLFVNPPQPPSISKSFSPNSIGLGGISTLTLSLGNGNATASSLTSNLTDTLPTNLVVASTPNIQVGGGCTLANVVATAGSGFVRYNSGGSLPAGGCSISVDVTSNTALTSYNNVIAAGALVTGVGSNAVSTSASLTVLPLPTVTKSFAPASMAAGASSTLTITLGNTSGTTLTLSQALTDTFPASSLGTLAGTLVIDAAATIGGTCINTNPGKVTATAGAGSVTYASGATIPAGGCTITVPVTSALGGVFNNTIAAGSLQTNIGNNPSAGTATLTVLGVPTISKGFSPTTILAGATSQLTISLGHANGTALALTSALTDTLPSGMTVATNPNIGGTCIATNPGKVTATAGAGSVTYANGATIPAGGCTITLDVTAPGGSSYTNTIASGDLKTAGGNNAAAATATLVVLAPGAVAKTFSPASVFTGDTSVLTITLGNTNAFALTLSAALTDTLPTGLVIAPTPNLGGSCPGTMSATAAGTTVTYASGASIPAGGCTITVAVITQTQGSFVNTIAAGALQTNAGNNSTAATATLTVVDANSALTVQKSVYAGHNAGAGCPGVTQLTLVDANRTPKNITWCFTVNNTGNTYLTSPVFVDAGLGITATVNQSNVRLKSGAVPLAPGATAVWYVEDTRTTSLSNTVTVTMPPSNSAGVLSGRPSVSGTAGSVIFAYVFDPPFGIKTGVLKNGIAAIRWTMVWINDNIITANNVSIADPIPVGMTYGAALTCTPQGTTVVVSCAFEAPSVTYPRGRVLVVANMGPDLGATSAATASNALQIAFDATINNAGVSQDFKNQGTSSWDPGGGVLTANSNGPQVGGGVTSVPFVAAVANVPTLSELGMLLLAMLMALLTDRKIRQAGGLRRR